MSGKSRACSYSGLTYGDQHNDPFDVQVALSEHIGNKAQGDIEAALEAQVESSKANLLSLCCLQQLRAIFGLTS